MASGMPPGLKKSLDSTKVEYANLGKSGLKVSVPILGAMSFGDAQWASWVDDEEKAMPLLKAAYDIGLNTWDTANVYSNGTSEEIIGKAIKKFDIPRHKLTILTKCHGAVGEEPGLRSALWRKEVSEAKDYVNQYGLSRAAIFNAVDASLKRLDTPYIDLLQIHRHDPLTPPEETMSALHDLIKSGKVRYIGASSMWTYQFCIYQHTAEKHGYTKFISMQNQHSLLYREEEREMNKFCDLTGVGLIPWGPLNAGKLARPLKTTESGGTERAKGGSDLTAADREILKRVEELAEKKGWKMSQVALAWSKKRITSPIIGFSGVERMMEAVESRGKTLTEEEEKYLEEPYVPKEIIGHT